MNRTLDVHALLAALALGLAACTTGYDPDSPTRAGDPPSANRRAQETIERFLNRDPGLQRFFDKSHAYALFPRVGKGGLIVGGTYGEGLVYEQGRLIGVADITQVTVGAQAGGQEFSEVIFFRDQGVLDNFKKGTWKTSAQTSAVLADTGSSDNVDYRGGVAIFTVPTEGAMVEASVGAQTFDYEPLG